MKVKTIEDVRKTYEILGSEFNSPKEVVEKQYKNPNSIFLQQRDLYNALNFVILSKNDEIFSSIIKHPKIKIFRNIPGYCSGRFSRDFNIYD
ncbi:MAG: hypothetical protein ACK4OM_01440 [Alphaproteobacteria bacterium]